VDRFWFLTLSNLKSLYTMRKSILLLLLFVSVSSMAQGAVESTSFQLMLKTLLSHTVPEVSVEDVDVKEDVILLDAREKAEYDLSHIEGAVWVGYDDFDMARVKEIAKDQKVIVYCSVGYRSEKVCEKLIEAGYEDASNLYGGIFEWGNQDMPVVDENGEQEKIHPFDNVWGLWLDKQRRATKY